MKIKSYLIDTIKNVWIYYGGLSAIAKSPFVYFSLIFTLISYNIWSHENWWNLVLEILPSLLGFTLGGYAILVAFGDEKFMNLISGTKNATRSPYLGLSSNFVIFILFQILAILIALISKALYVPLPSLLYKFLNTLSINPNKFVEIIRLLFWGFGYLLFIYSLSQTFAATLQIFRLTKWKDKYIEDAIGSDQDDDN